VESTVSKQTAIQALTASPSRFARPVGVATTIGGIMIIGLGAFYVARPPADTPSTLWLVLSALAAALTLGGLNAIPLGPGWGRSGLRVGICGMALFGAAHLVAVANADLGILLFSVLALIAGIALTVAGVAVVRAGVWSGWRRGLLLVCGLLPITAIPIGAAIGDTPHFTAIAVWGVCWLLLGIAVTTSTST